MNETYSVYVQTDEKDNIISVNSSAFLSDTTGWVQIDEGTGDKYHHAQGNYLEGGLYTMDGICRYKYIDGAATLRTDAEIEADRAEIPEPPIPEPTLEQRTTALEATQSDVVDILASALGVTI